MSSNIVIVVQNVIVQCYLSVEKSWYLSGDNMLNIVVLCYRSVNINSVEYYHTVLSLR